MRRSTAVIAVAIAVLALGAGIAHAITYGDRDGSAHPYVGLVASTRGTRTRDSVAAAR